MVFQCGHCGEIFTAEPDTHEPDPQGGPDVGHAVCPTCGGDSWEMPDD